MKKKIIIISIILGFILVSSVSAFAFDNSSYEEKEVVLYDPQGLYYTFQYRLNKLPDNLMYVYIYTQNDGHIVSTFYLSIVDKSTGRVLYRDNYKNYVMSRSKIDSSNGYNVLPYGNWGTGFNGSTGTPPTEAQFISSDIPYIQLSSYLVEGTTVIDLSSLKGVTMDMLQGDNYPFQNTTTNDMYYPIMDGVNFLVDDANNYTTFNFGFKLGGSNVSLSDITQYRIEIWANINGRTLYLRDAPLVHAMEFKPGQINTNIIGSSGDVVNEGQLFDSGTFRVFIGNVFGDILPFQRVSGDSALGGASTGGLFPFADAKELLAGKNGLTFYFRFRSGDKVSNFSIVDAIISTQDNQSPPTNVQNNVGGKPQDDTKIDDDKKEVINNTPYVSKWDDNFDLWDFVDNNGGMNNLVKGLQTVFSFLPPWFWQLIFFFLSACVVVTVYKLIRG